MSSKRINLHEYNQKMTIILIDLSEFAKTLDQKIKEQETNLKSLQESANQLLQLDEKSEDPKIKEMKHKISMLLQIQEVEIKQLVCFAIFIDI